MAIQEPTIQGTGTIYGNTVTQTMQSWFSGFFWTESHVTRFMYDNTHVWSTVTYRGYRGYHTCNNPSGGIGYDVQVTKCVVYNVQPSTYRIQSYDYFKLITYPPPGFPITITHAMHVNIYPSGSYYGHVDY